MAWKKIRKLLFPREIANITKKEIESRLGKSVVNNKNKLSYQYKDENKKLRNK